MSNPNKPSWLDLLVQIVTWSVVVTVVSFGVGSGGWGLFRFFSPPSAPTTKPPATSATIDNPEEEDKTESDQDSTSTSLVTRSERTNRLAGTPEAELQTLTASESDWDSVSLLSEPTVGSQDTTSLVARSDLTLFSSSSVAGSGSETAIGIPELEIKLEVETDLRRILALSQDLLIQKGNLFREIGNLVGVSKCITNELKEFLTGLTKYGATEQQIEAQSEYLLLAEEKAFRRTQKAEMAVLWKELTELEKSIPKIQDQIALKLNSPSPRRIRERYKRRERQQLHATSSSRNPRRIPLRSNIRRQSPDSSDSGILRISTGDETPNYD